MKDYVHLIKSECDTIFGKLEYLIKHNTIIVKYDAKNFKIKQYIDKIDNNNIKIERAELENKRMLHEVNKIKFEMELGGAL